jgi:Putative restriction endonuclease
MARHIEDEVAYYYDFHPTEEDLMGETVVHVMLVRYLVAVLTWFFHGQRCVVQENLNFHQTADPYDYPLAPDIAVIKGVDFQLVKSWRIGKTGPAPQVVFEIASEETWKKDLTEKPLKYARMGVQEYFAYDPNEPPLGRSGACRLYGWRLDPGRHVMRELPVGPDRHLWSVHLESWLVPDERFLRLYDRDGRLQLTSFEATEQARQAEARRAEVLAEKLRSLGIDPDQV